MNNQNIKVQVQILGNSYTLNCEFHERSAVLEAADYLNKIFGQLRSNSPSMSFEQLAILGAMQIAFELIQEKTTLQNEIDTVNQISKRLLEQFSANFEEVEDEQRQNQTTN